MAPQYCPYIGKTTWPELEGTNGDYAASVIKRENPTLDVAVFLDGTPVQPYLNCNRVRVWVDGNRMVIKVPTAG
ncbi:protease inhibitor HPI-like [Eutrema salsugineum]|uniref:protease inhibitor HPI-like n=1 Tax=Eutrema salsugineum TaxID=72664 RepID=UPI000CED3178|nr:protease inhibitor HPI-like [Eutrema salsugineum]